MVERLRAVGRSALLALAVVLPFEMRQPVARLGPIELSTVELFLYSTLAIWGVSLLARAAAEPRAIGRALRHLTAAHRAAAALVVVMFASAAAAAAPRAPAIKFALRSTGGVLLFAAAADLLRAPRAVARTAAALVAGAAVSALLGIAELRVSGAAALLRPFHAQTFEALGAPRASGPFQYSNIAAMYLEATAPLGLVLGSAAIWTSRDDRGVTRGGAARLALSASVIFLILDGVLATGSRAGIAGAVLAVAVACVAAARAPRARWEAWGAVAALVMIVAFASTSALAGRFRFWQDGRWYAATIARSPGATTSEPLVMQASAKVTRDLEIANRGGLRWSHDSASPVNLSYHWLDERGAFVILDGVRTPLPDDVAPGATTSVLAVVRAPPRPGRYVLWWDLVQEHTTWFSERGNPGLREAVLVRGEPPTAAAPPVATTAPAAAPISEAKTPGRAALWRAAVKLFRGRPWLGVGPDNFRHRYGPILGLSPTQVDERLHANNFYFETLADLGVAGCLTFGLLLLALARAARRAFATADPRMLAVLVAAALGSYLLHGFLDYFLEFTPTYVQFWLLAGMLVALQNQAAPT